MQVLHPDIAEYFSSFFITLVVAVFVSIFILQVRNVFFIIENHYVRNKAYFTYFLVEIFRGIKAWLYIFHTSW